MSENIIGIALDELYRWFPILNEKYYSNKLAYPVITIQKAKRSGNLAWFTLDRVWINKNEEDKEKDSKFEVNICADYLNRDIHEIIGSFHHELVHYANKIAEIRDCNGQIHNKKFKNLAEGVGLIVTKSKKYGFGHTECSPELIEFINEIIKPNEKAFEYFRSIPQKIAKPSKERKKSQFIYICPQCEEKIKAKADKNIICEDCGCKFEQQE